MRLAHVLDGGCVPLAQHPFPSPLDNRIFADDALALNITPSTPHRPTTFPQRALSKVKFKFLHDQNLIKVKLVVVKSPIDVIPDLGLFSLKFKSKV